MSLPKPQPGLVIWYDYVWHRDRQRGVEQGFKDRPCAVILVMQTGPLLGAVVLPITHRQPEADDGIEIPPPVKARLRLDGERSWVVISEANAFYWPGPDLRPRTPGDPSSVAIGFLPEAMVMEMRRRYRERALAGTIKVVPRREE